MNILEYIHEDAKTVPKTIGYKINHNLATLEDEDEACKDPGYAYLFARYIKGANIEKCRESSSKDPYWKERFERNIK